MRDLSAGRGPVTDALVGVLFEISIVCHVFVFVVWWVAGVSPVLGVVLVVCLVFWFLGLGFFLVLALCFCFMRLCGVGGGFWGVLGLGVICASGLHSRVECGGGGWVCGSALVWFGGRVCLVLLLLWWGLPALFLSWLGGWGWFLPACCGGGSGCFVFRLAFSCFFGSGLGPCGLGRGRGFGGVGLGWGLFSPAVIAWPGPGFGLGLVLFGEFDPGSGRTLAACLTHASRTVRPLWGYTSGEWVSNM